MKSFQKPLALPDYVYIMFVSDNYPLKFGEGPCSTFPTSPTTPPPPVVPNTPPTTIPLVKSRRSSRSLVFAQILGPAAQILALLRGYLGFPAHLPSCPITNYQIPVTNYQGPPTSAKVARARTRNLADLPPFPLLCFSRLSWLIYVARNPPLRRFRWAPGRSHNRTPLLTGFCTRVTVRLGCPVESNEKPKTSSSVFTCRYIPGFKKRNASCPKKTWSVAGDF
jgi:hypothetical protein